MFNDILLYMIFSTGRSKPLKILFVASEAGPYVKVGGLGEVMYSLPRALDRIGHDARVIIPRYASIDMEKHPMEMVLEGLSVPSGNGDPLICNIKRADKAYFLENQEFYEKRASVYGYDDDAARWALLSRGTLEFIRNYKDWRPDIIVACDWQGGLLPNYKQRDYKDDPILSMIPIVFSIHNLYYQGMFDHKFIPEMDYDDGQSEIPSFANPRLLKINFMRRGIMHADIINTVSPTYAQEITTQEYGELLDSLLGERRSKLFGILNGIDYVSNDPESDTKIEFQFSKKHLDERLKNKNVLRHRFNLPIPEPDREDPAILGMVTRLSEQKGLDLVMDVIESILETTGSQFIIVGTGDPKYMGFFSELDQKYANVTAHLSYDDVLPHLVYAGADIILVPSKYEPCGLTQMEAMRYGAIPIVRKTGGLADSVQNFDPKSDKGDGFVFDKYNNFSFFSACIRAIEAYRYPKVWQGIQKRAMSANFSWDKSATEYVKLFNKAMNFLSQSSD